MQNSINKETRLEIVHCGDGYTYRILDLIGTTSDFSSLYHARSVQYGNDVALKLLDPDTMLPEQMTRFRSEYEILRSLDVPGIIKPIALVDKPRCLMMILENVSGEPLEAVLNRQQLDVLLCLRLSLQLAQILVGLHAAHVVHHDFRPANLLLEPAQKLCLVDLSRATRNAAQVIAAGNPSVVDWAYVSPEQTGRMNRAVDYRTDFYSLGVMLYRMLTGQLPFHGNDALEWAHSHIASLPQPPAELRSDIPPMLSGIVMKLLEKMPEDRYQSARGLLYDLETCFAQLEKDGVITSFALGSQDMSQRIQIPQKLIGREAEIKQLLESFDAMVASGHTTLLLVSGPAGVGKSAVVHELRRPVVKHGGYFISGKFDQYQRDIPYATVTQAFRELVQQILAESEARIADYRRQILEAVGINGQLIIDVLPQMELIIGRQAPAPELPPLEAQNRFRLVFEKFIGVFAQQAHPLTLFLDDLQWVDAASLRLVKDLVTVSDKQYLLVIGAYRNNEVDPSHPLILAQNDLRKEGASINQLELLPLSEAALGPFIDAMLQCERCTTAPAARLIYEKTGGNPFFVVQFITALAEEHMITFDTAARTWRWDLDKISAKGYTDNVAELMVVKLARLPAPAQDTLQRLACLGSSAPISILMALCGQPEADIQAALSAAVHAGLISQTGDTVSFQHDRVQEAAYLSIPASARAALHWQIGRLLMAGKTQAQIEETIFTIVNQFNEGADGITDASDKALLCHLNFLAGKKAKAAIAYTSARSFLNRAMALLPADAWQQVQYQESFAIALALSECEYLVGNFQRADQLADLILANAQSNCDRARVYLLRMQLYQMVGRFDAAVDTMFEAVRLFGVTFPATGPEIEAAIDAEIEEISACLQGRRITDIADAPLLTDADMGMVIALLVEASTPLYFLRPDYYALVTARAVKLSLQHGNNEDSCQAYSTYGIVLLSRRGDIGSGIEFSEMTLQLNQKLGFRRGKGRLLGIHAIAFAPLKIPFASVMPILDKASAACLEVGDLLYANYHTLCYFWLTLQQGAPLDAVLDAVRKHASFSRDTHNDAVWHTVRFQQQLVANLKGRTHGPASMDDGDFDEALCFAVLEKLSFSIGTQMGYIVKQICAFIHGDYTSALASAQKASLKANEAGSLIFIDAVHHFYFALTLAALYPQVSGAEQRKFASMLAEELDRHRVWTEHCPQNFLDRHALVGAEIARIEGRDSDAERLYEQAIRSARENGFIQNAAIAFELASNFYRARGFGLIADAYLREARAGYLRWGADGKVAQLDARYPQLRTPHASTSGIAEDSGTAQLDVLSVAKASQAISGRIMLNELADTLLHIALENAGAQTGSLLLCRGAGLELAAKANVDQAVANQVAVQVRFYDRQALAEASLPASILNYVRRSREPVLLPDVAKPNPFSADAYFACHHPKSVLCLPILRQDALIGLLYLENNLVTHAFTPDRVTVLKLLASQAAISLENAQLYANLLQENSERKLAENAVREKEARIRRLVDSNIIGVVFGDCSGGIGEANDAFLQLCGYTRQDLDSGNLRWTEITPPEFRAADEHAIEELKRTGTFKPYEKEFIRKDGSRVPVLVGGALLEGVRDQAISFVLDLSARKEAENRTVYLAHHDALTGLPNRVLLQDRIQQALAHSHRNQKQAAILLIDLDYFKNINDSLGHRIGDVILQTAATRLQACLGEGDSVARLGGDEFVLCLPLIDDSSDVAQVAQQALDTLAQPFIVNGHELHVSGSIGISLYPDDGTDVETLMRTADMAMYHAKEIGRRNFQFFTEALNRAAHQRLEVSNRLRYALTHNEFVLHYQPQVDMESSNIFSVEALLRWQPPGAQPISCGAFIANAEESGLIVPIGEWILRQACKQLKVWHDAGHPELKLAINLSPRQMDQVNFPGLVGQILDETGIAASDLELEITESVLMRNSETTLVTLAQLSDMGIQLSLDDFGTGYSSLAYLQRFPVHALKIDQSFVRNIKTDSNNNVLITAIIAMAASLHLRVIAEGVETLQQVQFLLAHGCVAAQGFYFGKAVPPETLSELLKSNLALKPISQLNTDSRH